MENEGCVTGLGTLGRWKLCIMGMNWHYVHKENVDKQNLIKQVLLGGKIVHGKNHSNFPLPHFSPTFTFPLSWPM